MSGVRPRTSPRGTAAAARGGWTSRNRVRNQSQVALSGVRPWAGPKRPCSGSDPGLVAKGPVRGQTLDIANGPVGSQTRTARARTTETLKQLDRVADGHFAGLYDAGQHAALALQLGAKAVAELVHSVARIADHRDLELGFADAHALADRPLLDIVALDGDVLPDRPRLNVDRVEMLLRDEEDLSLRRVRVRAPLETDSGDRLPPVVPLRASALAG